MPQILKIAASQSPTLPTLQQTLSALKATTQLAASNDISILLFPEAYLGGYPRSCSFGAAVGSRTDAGREQYLQYYNSAVDLGDTPLGAGDAWLHKKLPVNSETGRRGDGTREFLEDVARETGVFIVSGLVERTGGSLFCTAVFVDPVRGMVGKRRKLMPTGSERLVWSQGTAASLKAVVATIKGVRVVMGCAICWENMMPLLRYSLYSQGVNLWLAPTADARDSWGALVRTIGMEGRCFVISANQCQKKSELPSWITSNTNTNVSSSSSSAGTKTTEHKDQARRRKSVTTRENNEIALPTSKQVTLSNGHDRDQDQEQDQQQNANNPPKTIDQSPNEFAITNNKDDEYVSRGGSTIVSPLGTFIVPPVWENATDLIVASVDFEDCSRAKLDFDATGHYSRADQFQLSVAGLDLIPPP